MNYIIKNINLGVLPDSIEHLIIKAINMNPPDCYDDMQNSEIKFLTEKFITNPEYAKYHITIEQIKSIRSGYVKNRMITTHKNLEMKIKNILKDYNNGDTILELSKKYNGSPLNILRVIFKKKYSKEKAKNFFRKPKLLNPIDFAQFELATKHDVFALINQDHILEQANQFEQDIADILDKLNIKYKTQAELQIEQTKSHGYAFNTPDFLIESDIKINGHAIKWIDAKNYYGSNVKFIKKNLAEQTKKYINTFGSGSVVYNLGFNESLSEPNILFLSYESIESMKK